MITMSPTVGTLLLLDSGLDSGARGGIVAIYKRFNNSPGSQQIITCNSMHAHMHMLLSSIVRTTYMIRPGDVLQDTTRAVRIQHDLA